MIKALIKVFNNVYYSFPIQLLLNHLQRNHVLLLCWLILFAVISGNFGNYLGVPYLFLDPVYLNEVNFTSFFIMGIALAGFSIAFHIASYIDDGHRFTFIGVVQKPFTTFSLNNSIIPFTFLICYVIFIIRYQLSNEYISEMALFSNVSGLLIGYVVMTLLMFAYFWFTNKDIFKYVVCKVDEKLKQNIKLTRANAMKKLNVARKNQIRVDHYFNLRFEAKKAEDHQGFYDRTTILQVFDQNHLNLVIIQLFIFLILLTMGVFKDSEPLQLPAAASAILFFTIFVMFVGAFSYWFGNWSGTTAVILLLIVNFLVKENVFSKSYQAFGLNYNTAPAPYNLKRIESLVEDDNIHKDEAATLEILNNWRAKFPSKKPKMVFLCVSGGGMRAALWTLNTLQKADSLTDGKLMDQTMLITGASGGLIGASYYRELILRKKLGHNINPYDKKYTENISSDNLNAIIFSLLMNDLFVGIKKFDYTKYSYRKDRGYSFEEQLNKNTDGILDKSLLAYKEPEQKSMIPMMIMAPTIINDGRKLYISPQNISYMMGNEDSSNSQKINGIEFLRFYEDQDSKNLRFLSGLRMSATFPYITPNITLPSSPSMEIIDAGITDNFGISDAIRYLYAFREWISENTSGVVILSIRDSQKDGPINKKSNLSLFERFSLPISSIYQNFESLQDINNDNKEEYAKKWFDSSIETLNIQYVPQDMFKSNLSIGDSLRMTNIRRASLSWRLTSREKQSLAENINSENNQKTLQRLVRLLE